MNTAKMRVVMACIAALAVSACEPAIPDSGAGVGFDDYDSYAEQQRQREAMLSGQTTVPGPSQITEIPLDGADAPAAANSGVPPLGASPSNPAPQIVSTEAGISRENDFDAVSGQRTIQDDAALIAQNRSQYQVIQPTDLPARTGSEGPNIVAFALATSNPVGVPLYQRSGFNAQNRFARNCAAFVTSDQAQEAFLANGGPQRDRRGLDPDGDGFACNWDPTPFRAVRSGG